MEGFYNGDEIYCKSSNNNEWHGPGVAIGQVGATWWYLCMGSFISSDSE